MQKRQFSPAGSAGKIRAPRNSMRNSALRNMYPAIMWLQHRIGQRSAIQQRSHVRENEKIGFADQLCLQRKNGREEACLSPLPHNAETAKLGAAAIPHRSQMASR